MRLISRNRQRRKAPRISISQAEITADLNYPAALRQESVERRGQRGRHS